MEIRSLYRGRAHAATRAIQLALYSTLLIMVGHVAPATPQNLVYPPSQAMANHGHESVPLLTKCMQSPEMATGSLVVGRETWSGGSAVSQPPWWQQQGEQTDESREEPVAAILQSTIRVLPAAEQAPGDEQLLQIEATLLNKGPQSVLVPAADSSFSPFRGDVLVVRCGQVTMPYIGPTAKVAPPDAGDLVLLSPGESITSTISANQLYTMRRKCHYSVRMHTTPMVVQTGRTRQVTRRIRELFRAQALGESDVAVPQIWSNELVVRYADAPAYMLPDAESPLRKLGDQSDRARPEKSDRRHGMRAEPYPSVRTRVQPNRQDSRWTGRNLTSAEQAWLAQLESFYPEGLSNVERALLLDAPRSKVGNTIVSFNGHSCSAREIDRIMSAFGELSSLINNAMDMLDTRQLCGPVFQTFFAPIPNAAKYLDAHYELVLKHFTRLASVRHAYIVCDSVCAMGGSKTYAYVYPDSAVNHIYLCPWFFTRSNDGYDRPGGVLLHELTHFDRIAATHDYRYGLDSVKKLAKREPKRAVRNADSYEYYAETLLHIGKL